MIWEIADLLLFLVPLLFGIGTSYYQKDLQNGEPSRRLAFIGYAGVFTIIFAMSLYLLSILQYLPRMAYVFGVSNVPLGYVLGYSVFQIVFKKQRPRRRESILLVGLILSGVIANVLFTIMTTLFT